MVTIGLFNHLKSLPNGLSFEGDIHYTDDVDFLCDLTYENKDGDLIVEQQIFDGALAIIEDAEDFIIVDMFLFHDYMDQDRDLSGQLTESLPKTNIS